MNKSNAIFLIIALVVLAMVGFFGGRWLMPMLAGNKKPGTQTAESASVPQQVLDQAPVGGNRPDPYADKNTQAQPELLESNQPEKTTSDKSGSYLPFTPEVLNSAATGRRVLFFYANWCPTCASAQKDFETNLQQLPGDVTLIRVNYNDTDADDDEKALAKQYGITYQHTFVQIDENGKALLKWNGGELQELLDKLSN